MYVRNTARPSYRVSALIFLLIDLVGQYFMFVIFVMDEFGVCKNPISNLTLQTLKAEESWLIKRE